METKDQLKAWFRKGLYPTESQFAAWIDSYWHKSEKMPYDSIEGLALELNSKANVEHLSVLGQELSIAQNNISNLNSRSLIRLKNTAKRTNGRIYIDMDFSDYQKTRTGYFSAFLEPFLEVVNEGVQDTSIQLGYEDLYVRSISYTTNPDDDEVYIEGVFLSLQTMTRAKLKDVAGKSLLMFGSADDYLCLIGVEEEQIVSVDPIPDSNIVLFSTAQTYEITEDSSSVMGLSANTNNCSVILSPLSVDKTVTFVIKKGSMPITFGSSNYCSGDTVFCVYDSSEGLWSINNTKPPLIPDYSDVNVKYVLDNVNFKSYSTIKTSDDERQVHFPPLTFPLIDDNSIKASKPLVLVVEDILYEKQNENAPLWLIKKGLYYLFDTQNGYKFNIKKLADIDSLSLVTCDNENLLTRKGIWKVVKSTASKGSYFVKIDDAYTKTETYNKLEVDNKLSSVYKYKGSLNSYSLLPSTGQANGDVYNVVASAEGTNINYAWNGSAWDNLGGIEPLATATNNGLMSISDFTKLAAISGANTGDETKASVESKLLASNLSTSSKEIVPAINELKTLIGSGGSTARSEYLAAYLASGTFDATGSYSKMSLLQKTYESGLNMKSVNTSIVGNRIQTTQAGKYRVDLTFSLYGGSGDVNLVLAIRKYNTTKYSTSGNYRVEKELAGFTKDTNLIGCTISCSFELEMDANDVGVTPTGIEVALKATANPSTIHIPANACHISIEKIA